jgi:hypothetical protein
LSKSNQGHEDYTYVPEMRVDMTDNINNLYKFALKVIAWGVSIVK